MNTKQKIQEAVAGAVPELALKPGEVHIEHPADLNMGDYSSNVAMAKAKALGTNPRKLAEKIKDELADKIDGVEKIEVAGPGFINFYLSKAYFETVISGIGAQERGFGTTQGLTGTNVIIEYTNTNVLKPMHIGHLMGNVIGESLSRIMEWRGAEVKRDTYEGDVGLHVAKALWGIRKLGGIVEAGLSEQAEYIGRAYAEGANAYEDDAGAKKEIEAINKQVFEKSDANLNALYEWGRKVSLEHFEELYKKLGTKFDFYFFESEIAKNAVRVIEEYLEKGLFESSDGAVVFRGEKYDPALHTRVFVTKQGLPTYEAKDIAHAIRKYETYPADRSYIVTANEQSDYFRVVLRALREIDMEIAGKTAHIAHGMLRFASGKMSSRKGNVITGESMILNVEGLVREKMKDRDMSESEKDEVAEAVAVAAIKYSVLKQAPGRDIIFDFDKSLSFEGDSGPYLQYAAVRAGSVLEKAKSEGVKPDASQSCDEVTPLERLLARFPEVVETAGEFLSPNYVATYLIELSAAYNSYYADHKIVDKNDPASPYRIALTKAFRIVMENGLFLLGMKVPRRM